MSAVNINVRTDAKTKKEAEMLFSELGLNMTTAINVFLKKSIQYGGIPFEIRSETPNATTIASFEEGKAILADPNRKGYGSIEELKKALDV